MYPQWFIDKLKASIPMKQLAEEYTTLEKTGMRFGKPYYTGLCPHPDHKDHDPSFRVWEYSNSWACMTCHQGKKSKDKNFKNEGSDQIAFIVWIEKKPWKEAVKFLAEKYNIPLPEDKNQKLFENKKRLAYSYMDNLQGTALNYLTARGLSKEDCFEWGIGYDGKKIIFPLLDRYKNILAFTKRWINMPENCEDKYKNSANSPIFNKSMYLYGTHKLDTDFKEIRITEGTMDVILADKYGAKNMVATLGTAFTDSHIEILKHYKLLPVFCMDGDKAGLRAINKSAALLAEHNIYCKVLILPDGKDMADLALELKDGIEDYINEHSITYGNYLISNEMNNYLAKLNELKLNYYPKLLSILKQVPTTDEQKILKSHIKNLMNIDI
jgi:DNA primase